MQWGNASYLHALWLVAALAVFMRWSAARRRRALESFAEPPLLPGLVVGLSARRRRIGAALFLAALALAVVALAQPKWGYRWRLVRREGIDIVIAIDTSKSMLAADVKPDRLTRAKMEVNDLLGCLQGDRVALVGVPRAALALASARAAAPQAQAAQLGGRPSIVPRASWGGDLVPPPSADGQRHHGEVVQTPGPVRPGDLPEGVEPAERHVPGDRRHGRVLLFQGLVAEQGTPGAAVEDQ